MFEACARVSYARDQEASSSFDARPGRATGRAGAAAIRRSRSLDPANPRRDEGRAPDLPRAGRAISPAHRRVRQERAGDQRHRDHESGGAEAGRRDGSAVQARRTVGPAPLHPDHRQRQLRNDRAAERQRLARAGRVCVEQGCVPGREDQGGRRDRDRQVEHGRVGVHAERDPQLDPAGLHEESLRARSRHRGIERRHRGVGGGQLRHRRPRQRHRQLDPRARPRTRRWPAFARRWD